MSLYEDNNTTHSIMHNVEIFPWKKPLLTSCPNWSPGILYTAGANPGHGSWPWFKQPCTRAWWLCHQGHGNAQNQPRSMPKCMAAILFSVWILFNFPAKDWVVIILQPRTSQYLVENPRPWFCRSTHVLEWVITSDVLQTVLSVYTMTVWGTDQNPGSVPVVNLCITYVPRL